MAELWRFITNGGIQHAASGHQFKSNLSILLSLFFPNRNALSYFISGKCLDEDTDHDDDGRNDHEVSEATKQMFLKCAFTPPPL